MVTFFFGLNQLTQVPSQVAQHGFFGVHVVSENGNRVVAGTRCEVAPWGVSASDLVRVDFCEEREEQAVRETLDLLQVESLLVLRRFLRHLFCGGLSVQLESVAGNGSENFQRHTLESDDVIYDRVGVSRLHIPRMRMRHVSLSWSKYPFQNITRSTQDIFKKREGALPDFPVNPVFYSKVLNTCSSSTTACMMHRANSATGV